MYSRFTLESTVKLSSLTQMSAMVKSPEVYHDLEFMENNKHIANTWKRIGDVYPEGASEPLLPETFSRDQFGQGNHYECFMLSALSTLIRFPDVIRHCFVTTEVQPDGHYTFQFFRDKEWVKVEIDDYIAMESGETLYIRSPTRLWWPLLLEKAYAKFYTAYDHLEGCTLQEAYHDLTGNPVLNIPTDARLAKAAFADVSYGSYWLDLAERVQSGRVALSALTRDLDVESMGLQREQQYGILSVFSLFGTSHADDIVIQLHNPFEDEEYTYTGPLNRRDTAWTAKLRSKYNVDDERSIFMPLRTLLKVMSCIQLCYLTNLEETFVAFDDEWKGPTAGGNPTMVTWRSNPLYLVRNNSTEEQQLVVTIAQRDQREHLLPEESPSYAQCGLVLCQCSAPRPMPTFWVTGNNHRHLFKSLFLNSREVTNRVTVPPNSLCYLVASCLTKGTEAPFRLEVRRKQDPLRPNRSVLNAGVEDGLTVEKLEVPSMDWEHPIVEEVEMQMRTKDRIDFFVEHPTDVHVLLHQNKPYFSKKTGGDAMAQDYVGVHLYDDTDHRITGVHAATNFRETSLLYSLPRSGRYALSITCPRGKGNIPVTVTVVTAPQSGARRVDAPAGASTLEDADDAIEDNEGPRTDKKEANPIDMLPVVFHEDPITETPDSNTPFEDNRFMSLNRAVTTDPWVHIGDLYPVGKTLPLLPEVLSREQFQRGTSQECACLTAFAVLVEHHPDVIRHCFVSQQPRKDGRYVFRFHRYGRWVSVEIDDRIPQMGGRTVFCESPTEHWWPLLLEKAYAKFYSMYHNLEGCTMDEIFHDFTGRPVLAIPTKTVVASFASRMDVQQPQFWLDLGRSLEGDVVASAVSRSYKVKRMGIWGDRYYGVLGCFPLTASPSSISDIVVKLFNPYGDAPYEGPMDQNDPRWTPELRARYTPEVTNLIYMPVDTFCDVFVNMQQAYVGAKALVTPSLHFHSEWAAGTNGGNPNLLSWRDNPLYVVRNTSNVPVDILAMIRQEDQRHVAHTLPDHQPNYIYCGLTLSKSDASAVVPTYLVTGNNHAATHKGLFLNSREVSNAMTIPPKSLCYLVPSAMYHEMSPFILSYWLRRPEDEGRITMERLDPHVARRLPAVEHFSLSEGQKHEVHFHVDVATDAHVLLTLLRQLSKAGASEITGDDCVSLGVLKTKGPDGIALRLAGSLPSNFKESGHAIHLTEPGTYVVVIQCTKCDPAGELPCRVEVVCTEEAHVRLVDAEEHSPPHVEAVVEAPVAEDQLVSPPRAAPVEEAPREVSPIGDVPFLHDEYRAIPTAELNLMDHPDFAEKYNERVRLLQSAEPSVNASRVSDLEDAMHNQADAVATAMHENERAVLDPTPEGIPLELLPLDEDPVFRELEEKRRARRASVENGAPVLPAVEQEEVRQMNLRAHELARSLKAEERELFLHPVALGVPCSELPLDEDPTFSKKEVERIWLRRRTPKPEPSEDTEEKINALNDALNQRAEDLAKTILESERPTFLDAEHLHVRNEELPLSEDRPFVLAEAQRHELLLRTLKANDEDAESQEQQEEDLHRLDAQLNGMAEAMAADFLAKQRPHYLATEYGGHLTSDLPLNNHDEFLLHEQEYRDLQKGTIVVGEESRAVQAQLQREAAAIAKEVTREDRPHFLKASYHGVPLEELPLDANEKIAALESRRAQLLREPARNHVELQTVERKIESCVEQLAKNHAMKDVSFLEPYPDGVPIALVPLSEDAEFSRMASQRVALRDMSDVGTEELEHKMNARAVELAHAYKDQQRRTYYTVGLPIESLPLDSDDIFAPLERQRFDRMATHYVGRHGNHPRGNDICRMEEQLQARAEELNRMARDNLCRSFLDPTPLSIPLAEIPLDTDPSFVALEKELYATASSRSPLTAEEKAEAVSTLQHAMQRRVYELAAEELERRMPFIDAEPEGVPLSYLTVLGTDAPFASLSARYKVTRQPSLQESLNKRVHELAKHQKEVEREEFLASSPDGVPVEQLHLDEDADFARWEQERRALKESADANDEATKDRIREIERLMNERAMKLAREQKWRDRERIVGGCVPPQVLLRALPFDETPDFIHAENTRYDLLSTVSRPPSSRGPTPRNAPEISEAMHARIHPMEETMQSIARDLAQNALWDDRDSYLDPEPEDIPIREVPLDEDADFVRQEVKRHSLLFPANPATTPLTRDDMVIKRLEQELNDRAHELAREMKLKHREQVIGTRPDGVPLNDVPLDGDAEFTELEKELWHLKSTPRSEREVEVAPWLKPEYHGVVQGDLSFVKTDPVLQRLAQELFVMGAPHDAPAGTEAAPLQVQLHDRVGVLTLAQLKAERDAFLPSTIRGVAREELPLNHDVIVVPLEHKLRVVKGETAPDIPDAPRSQVERKLESEIAQRVDQIALVHTFTRLDFLPSCPEGIPLRCLPIHSDPAFVRMEGQAQRWLQTAPKEEEVEALRNAMVQRVHELAMDAVHAERRRYLDYPRLGYTTPEEVDAFPHGCLDEDAPYRARERQWYGQVCRPKQHQVDVPQQEQALNDQAEELLRDAGLLHQAPPVLAQEDAGAAVAPEPEEPMISEDAAAAAHPSEDEADEEEQEQQEEDEGDDEEAELPNEEMPPQEEEEPRDVFPAPVEADREGSMPPNWGDAAFHAANRHVASLWPRLPELYPEGVGLPLLPRKPHSSEVRSAPDDVSYMAPFIAALGRYPVLLERLIATPQELDGVNDNRSPVRGSAQQEMYTFKFFDPNSRPIFVEVDDRVPCTEQREPMFTLSPRHQWYPLLLEKAYAKFVGGYERLDDCTSHETLRDLTGRPVTHLPLDTKLSRDVHHCDCHDILFWRGLGKQVKEGDAVIATSNDVVPDGLHPNSYYAVFDVLELVPGSTKVSDVVIKILNTFPGGTPYDGPLHAGDPHWTDELHRACRTNFADEPDFLYIPQAVFIRNFASLQHCHVQCGDRLTVLGEWDRLSAGSNPKYTTFRQNPVFLVENKSSQPVSLLAELRHRAPVFYDANHVGVYHDTALALLRTAPNVSVVAPLLTYNTHQFIHKGLLTDAREVCSEMELPPRSACYLVPYSRKRKCYGKFQLSVYPKDEPVEFTPLIPLSTTHRSIVAEVVALPGTGQGTRVDFAISNPCDVHILLHQDKITDPASVKNGDYLAEDEVMMAVYENNTVLLTTTGEASNAREHALSFQAERQGRYTVLVGCPSAARTGDCPCTLTVFTPLDVASKFLAIPEEKPSRFSPRRPRGALHHVLSQLPMHKVSPPRVSRGRRARVEQAISSEHEEIHKSPALSYA